MNIKEMLEAFTGGLAHEVSDIGGSATSARTQISDLLREFSASFVQQVASLDKAIAEILNSHAEKATRLATIARAGELTMPSATVPPEVSTAFLDEPVDSDTARIVAMTAPTKAAA
jgi:hypothetical protein